MSFYASLCVSLTISISLQTLTYALAKVDVLADKDSAKDMDRQKRPQNQIGLVLLCEFIASGSGVSAGKKVRLSATYRLYWLSLMLQCTEVSASDYSDDSSEGE